MQTRRHTERQTLPGVIFRPFRHGNAPRVTRGSVGQKSQTVGPLSIIESSSIAARFDADFQSGDG